MKTKLGDPGESLLSTHHGGLRFANRRRIGIDLFEGGRHMGRRGRKKRRIGLKYVYPSMESGSRRSAQRRDKLTGGQDAGLLVTGH